MLSILDGHLEDASVPFERELVHGVDLVQVQEDKEESGGDLTTGAKGVSSLIDLLHGTS